MPRLQPSVGNSPDILESLILDLLEWIGRSGRPYDEVIDAWRTSCPRLPVWEDANERGFVDRKLDGSCRPFVALSACGLEHVQTVRPKAAGQKDAAEG